jgi:endonuclease/exonuclease/phosphatase family metal-dependent hydrolase
MTDQFRVVTYNIHKCKGLDFRTSPARIAEVLRETEADVIALQEVVSATERADKENQAGFIAGELGFCYSVGENRRLRGASYGNVVLSRFPIVEMKNFDITVAGREPRGCLLADIKMGERAFLHLYNLHLGTAFFERRKQVKKLLDAEILNCRHQAPRILLGDFNEWTHDLTSRLLKAHFGATRDLREAMNRRRTYPGVLPLLHLDHIYYDNHLELTNAFLHRSCLALIASDHLPLVTDFRMKN